MARFIRMLLATGVFLLSACASDPQVKGAAIGALGGAALGQLLGGSTAATLGGAAIGGVAGGLVGQHRRAGAAQGNPCQPIYDRLAQDPNYLAYPADIQAEISGDLCSAHLEGY